MAMAGGMTQAQSATFTHHGGRIDHAMRRYPQAPGPWIDLSTGINPQPWAPSAPLTVDRASLPGRDTLAALEAAAADYFGVARDRVAAVPGSEIALRLLPALGLGGPVRAVTPCYGTHVDIASETIRPDRLGAMDGTLLVANPNNPDGRLIAAETLLGLASGQARNGGWLVVDEAFSDAVPGASVLPESTGADRLIVLRSFGKFFGLAGLRLGFVVAPPVVLARLRALLGDWPVSAEAIVWGTAAYRDDAWIASTRERIVRDGRALDALLQRHGITASGACPLFRLAEVADAPALFDRLACAGILVRPFADHPHWLRFGLPGTTEAWARLEAALAQ